ncbi:hypothetical protein PI125_g25207 [Phytophthora idaei]|nr:hypothetical protein PI125_g25207 [Phytophthora idaei]
MAVDLYRSRRTPAGIMKSIPRTTSTPTLGGSTHISNSYTSHLSKVTFTSTRRFVVSAPLPIPWTSIDRPWFGTALSRSFFAKRSEMTLTVAPVSGSIVVDSATHHRTHSHALIIALRRPPS